MKGLTRSLVALVGVAALTVGLAACGSSKKSTAGGGAVKLRLGYVTTPQHPYGISLDAFAKAVASASGGKLTIENVPSYTGGDLQLFDDVVGGTIEMAAVSTAIWDTKGSNTFQALQAPFLISNYGLAGTVEGGPIGQAMLKSANGPAKFSLVGLGILEGGLRKPISRGAPLKNPSDFKGKKIREPQSKVLSAATAALGGEPVAIPVGDVFSALQNGTVDGVEGNLGLLVANKWNEVTKNVTQNVNLWPFPAAVVISKAQFDKLTAEQQGWLQTAGTNLNKVSISVFTNPAPGATNFVKVLCDAGYTFAFASDADIAALTKAVEPAYTQLSADTEVAGFIKQIQDAKAAAGAPPAPLPLPAGCKKA